MLTVAQLREHITTELGDDALGRLLDAAYEAIAGRAGPSGDVQELLTAGPGPLLMLSKAASLITTIIEREVTLEDDDYELRSSGQMLLRLDDGTNPARRWRGRIDVTYTPISNDAERDRVAIELIRLEMNYQPLLSAQSLGQWSENYATGGMSYTEQRETILASLDTPILML